MSDNVAIDKFSKLGGSVSGARVREGFLLRLREETGFAGGRRFVLQLDSSDESFADHFL